MYLKVVSLHDSIRLSQPYQSNMLKRIIAISCILLGLSLSIFAQKKIKTEDVVYLKNGSVLRGILTERVPGSHLVIMMVGGNELKVEEAKVDRVVQENPANKFLYNYLRKNGDQYKGSITGRQQGLAFQWSMIFSGSQTGDGWGTVTLGLNMKVLYHMKKGWSLGGGMALSPYGTGGTTPVFAEVQKVFTKQEKVAQFFGFGQAGYGYGVWNTWSTNDFKGGVMGQIGGGLILNTRRRTEWLFTLGLNIQQASWENRANWGWPPVNTGVFRESAITTLQVGIGMGI